MLIFPAKFAVVVPVGIAITEAPVLFSTVTSLIVPEPKIVAPVPAAPPYAPLLAVADAGTDAAKRAARAWKFPFTSRVPRLVLSALLRNKRVPFAGTI